MKFAFSTLACPNWSFEEIIATAKDFGFDGIELRGIQQEIFVPKTKPFQPEALPETKKRLKALNLSIPMLASECVLASATEETLEDIKAYIQLAKAAEVPYVRVLAEPYANPSPELKTDLQRVKELLIDLGAEAKANQVKLLVETNGVLADSKVMAGFMESIAGEGLGVLWDVHHPFRYFNEDITETYERLKPYICYLHTKDSVLEGGQLVYKLMGQGDIPNEKLIELLCGEGYEGYISLEWVKRWNQQMEAPGIVFPHFISYMNRIKAKYSK